LRTACATSDARSAVVPAAAAQCSVYGDEVNMAILNMHVVGNVITWQILDSYTSVGPKNFPNISICYYCYTYFALFSEKVRNLLRK
jgi:hypothetical protein